MSLLAGYIQTPSSGGTADGAVLARADIVGLTGGGATALDSIATAALDAGTIVVINHATYGIQHWVLTAGTDAEDAAGGIVRPDDYATTTNEKVWVQR